MKAKTVWILVVLAVLAAGVSVFLLLSQRFLGPSDLEVKPFEKGLRADETILVKTRAERFGVQKGDAFRYLVEVWYDPDRVTEIDRSSLAQNVNLEPFEIRGVTERAFDLEAGTRVYQRAYEIQLISGQVEHLYEFPTLVVRYRVRGSEGLEDIVVVPEPVYVASRLPSDITDLDLGAGPGYGPLRPVRGKIEDVRQNRLPWILWALGSLLVALAAGDLVLRVIPQWKEKGPAERSRKVDIVAEAYSSLLRNVEAAVEPKLLYHQMDRILRMVLARKENIGILEDPLLDTISPEIGPSVVSLFEQCQTAYRLDDAGHSDVGQALAQLEKILGFYYGEGEIAEWRS